MKAIPVLSVLAALGILLPPTVLLAESMAGGSGVEVGRYEPPPAESTEPRQGPRRPVYPPPVLPDLGIEEGDAWDPETDPPLRDWGQPRAMTPRARAQTFPARPEIVPERLETPATPDHPGVTPVTTPETPEGDTDPPPTDEEVKPVDCMSPTVECECDHFIHDPLLDCDPSNDTPPTTGVGEETVEDGETIPVPTPEETTG